MNVGQTISSLCNGNKPFLMPIEDVFPIAGRGTAVTGSIET